MRRYAIFAVGILGYLVGASVYFGGIIGFLTGLLCCSKTAPFGQALLINVGLMVLWGLPHSLMARQSFKRRWMKVVPQAIERSIYMLQAGLLMALLIWQWRAMPGVVWHVAQPAARALLWALFGLGWVMAFIATVLINHFELTGLQQTWAYLRNREAQSPDFRTPFLYKVVRHPMQLGVLIAFWAAPTMTVGRLVFALGMTAYILIGLRFEERDLLRRFGQRYRTYQARTPMLVPGWHQLKNLPQRAGRRPIGERGNPDFG
jgi:protein-S-isoprenylcysteine O-methyltransferase Ste14